MFLPSPHVGGRRKGAHNLRVQTVTQSDDESDTAGKTRKTDADPAGRELAAEEVSRVTEGRTNKHRSVCDHREGESGQ